MRLSGTLCARTIKREIVRRELEARRQKLFEVDTVGATRQIIDFSAIQALKMVVVVQVRFFVQRFTTGHLDLSLIHI